MVAHPYEPADAADDAKMFTQKCAYFPYIDLTSRRHHLTHLPSQQSDALVSPYSTFHDKLWLIQKCHAESGDTKILMRTWLTFSTSIWHLETTTSPLSVTSRVSDLYPQTSLYSVLRSILRLTQKNHAESDDAKILAWTGVYFSDIDLTSRNHHVT